MRLKALAKLIGIFLVYVAGFLVHGALAISLTQWLGLWRGLSLSSFVSGLCLFLGVILSYLWEARKQSLPALLLKYGELVAEDARRRK